MLLFFDLVTTLVKTGVGWDVRLFCANRDVAKFDRSRSRRRCRRNRKGLSFFYIMTSVHSELSQYIENIEKYRKLLDRRSIEFRKVPTNGSCNILDDKSSLY